MSGSGGFRPFSGVLTGSDRWQALLDLSLACFFPAYVWSHAPGAHDPVTRFLLVVVTLCWLIAVPLMIRRWLVRRRWKPGTWGVVVVDVGPQPRRVRAELRRSLGVDPGRARRMTRQGHALVARDVDSLPAHVLGARLTLAGADARVVPRSG